MNAQIYTGHTGEGMKCQWCGVGVVLVVVAVAVGGGGGLVVGFNKVFCKQMTSFQIQSYISVPQLPKEKQI